MTTDLDTLPKIGAPAARALAGAGGTSLRQLAGVPPAPAGETARHGPEGAEHPKAALAEHGLALGRAGQRSSRRSGWA